MYKKLLCVGVLACGINNVVLAEDFDASKPESQPAFNAETSSTDVVNAYNPGIYLGGQLGMSSLHYGPHTNYLLPRNGVENQKFAGRACLGYAFSQFIALELGYDYYGQPKFKDNITGNTQQISQQGIDFSGKASLPLDYGFGFYIKAGLAWVHRSALTDNAGNFASKDANNKFAPLGGLGVNYSLTQNLMLDLGWTKTMTISNLATADLITLGLTYKFTV